MRHGSALHHARWVSEGERSCESLPERGRAPRQADLLRTSRQGSQGGDKLGLSCFQNSGGNIVPRMLL